MDVDWGYQTCLNDETVIEPSVEHGYDALDETKVQIKKWTEKGVNGDREDCHASLWDRSSGSR